MIEFYPQIRVLHIAAVIASGSLFLLRGLLARAGRGDLALLPLPRYLSYAVDTALLLSALALVAILPAATFVTGWLYAKLALLPVYIACAYVALRGAAGGARQLVCLAAALLAFGAMIAIARAHDPFGPLRPLLG
ncbi:MAG TPA: SirB2 family protein [Steroidobacteraceae bacterium]|nr:SirB2 family protein [Steroidobacteraceae bacterium]